MNFFKIQRYWQDSEVFGKATYSERDAWIWIVGEARWKIENKPILIKGRPVKLKRGQLSHSLRFMADKFGWSRGKVDRFMKKIRAWDMIEIETVNGTAQNIITVCNYNKYQEKQKQNGTVSGTESGRKPGQERDKEEESKESKESKDIKKNPKLEELSVEHISEWLEKRRAKGDYISVDEHKLLDKFRNWCESKEKTYKNYVAAYRNAFEWDNPPKKQKTKGQVSDWNF